MSARERIFAPVAPATAGSEPCGIYVHVPFCSAICPYCDFAVASARPGDASTFVESLLGEIDGWLAPGVAFDTVYFGGGTPSLLTAEQLGRIVARLRARFELAEDVRISLEVNPEDVDEDAVSGWKELGVHTVSLGVQAFGDEDLRRLGRRHRRELAVRSTELAVEGGFEVVSIDLIYGLLGGEAWGSTLERAVATGVDHLSCYELTVHEGTPFWRLHERGRLRLADEGRRAAWFLDTHRRMSEIGWVGYEVSSFASGERARSRHNRKYWRHVPYLGLGPSAHSFDGRRRWWNERDWRVWSARLRDDRAGGAVAGEEDLGARELGLEILMLGLRTRDGVELERYRRASGIDLEAERAEELCQLGDQGLADLVEGRLRPTLEGMAVAESLALRLA